MRLFPSVLCSAIAALTLSPQPALAAQESYETARISARRELQLAKIEFCDYRQVIYTRIRRELDARIELTNAEIRIYRERLRWYQPFDRYSTSGALGLTMQDLRLCLREAELRLQALSAERSNLIRFRTPEWRILELRVYDARLRVAAIEAQADSADDGA